MFQFLPYLLKGFWGHRARAMLTVSGTAVALFVFCFVSAVQDGLLRLTQDKQAQRTLVVFQENRFCPTSSRLPQDYTKHIAELPSVTGVIPIKVVTNNCRASLDAIVFQGMPAEKLRSSRELNLTAGSWSAFEGADDGALVGQAVANRRNLSVGKKFTINEVTVLVTGVFQSPTTAEENLIYTHLDFLQRARGQNSVGTVTQMEVHLSDDADVDHVAATIDAHYRGGPVATTTRTKGMFQADTLADLAELIGFIHYLGYACVGLVLALVATTTVMSVQDRIKEHGVLQTIGLRPNRIFRLIVSESTLLSTAGGLLGIGAGLVFLSFTGLAVAAEGVTISFRPSMDLAITGAIVSVVVGVLAGIIPGIQAARTKIVTALRQAG
ncbi:MAG: ABC transporter permease [Planctomycetota bacterium]|nr:MAG: ABC transporter permease [Planctomycetota bacterium]REJ88765.1 MAG: ABC transporter permease [Planctomycetota bacterium]REK24983.1 MAG: ABC transporter permease [Planctomycetota bacterium]REK46107.1 MAG: ABC transporter permease [Planctomycetota bacterium]